MSFKRYNDSIIKLDFINDKYFDILAVNLDNTEFTTYKRLAQFIFNDLGFAMHFYQRDIDDVYYNNLLKMFKSAEFINNFKELINKAINKKKLNFISVNWDDKITTNTKVKGLINYLFNVLLRNYIMQHKLKITATEKFISHITSTILVFNAEQI